MFEHLFQSTVSALCYEIAASHRPTGARGDGDPLAPPYNDVTSFVLEQHRGMPQWAGAALRLATLLFDLAALPGGTLFHLLPPQRRGVHLEAWTLSGLTPCRDLMRFYNSLVILALYSRPRVAQAMGQAE